VVIIFSSTTDRAAKCAFVEFERERERREFERERGGERRRHKDAAALLVSEKQPTKHTKSI
jgi:hypothetical protein